MKSNKYIKTLLSDENRTVYFCPFVLTQKNEKVKTQLKPFGENSLMDRSIKRV